MPTTKQLLELAAQHKEQIQATGSTLNDATRFVLAFKLSNGKREVTNQAVYQAYSQWSPNPINKIAFGRQFSDLFIPQYGRMGRKFYLLNKSTTQLLGLPHHDKQKKTKQVPST